MLLERVAQGGARHRCGVTFEKRIERGAIPLARFAQHPTDGRVHKVVPVVDERLSQPEGLGHFARPYHGERRDHRETPAPQQGRRREVVEHRVLLPLRPVEQPRPRGVRRDGVDKIPVIEVLHPGQHQRDDLVTCFYGSLGTLVDIHREDRSEQPRFVDLGLEQSVDVVELNAAAVTRERPNVRHMHADEHVPLGVTPRKRLEVARIRL